MLRASAALLRAPAVSAGQSAVLLPAARAAPAAARTQLRLAHHSLALDIDTITPPAPKGERLVAQFRKLLKTKTPKGYRKVWRTFNRAMAAVKEQSSSGAQAKQWELDELASACTFMMDHTYARESNPKGSKGKSAVLGLAQVEELMQQCWIPVTGDSYAAIANWYLVEGDVEGTEAMLEAASHSPDFSITPRLKGLLERRQSMLVTERTAKLKHAVQFGQTEEAWGLFTKLEAGELATKADYLQMLWGCESHADLVAFLERVELVSAGRGWELDPEAYNAQFWSLQRADRYDDMHELLEQMIEAQVDPTDRTMYVLRRANERLRRQRRMAADDRSSWEVVGGLDNAAVRRRVGL